MSSYIHNPHDIETKSFEIIQSMLKPTDVTGLRLQIIKRVIHTTADFEFQDLLCFKEGVENKLLEAVKAGCTLISDTNMIKSGINKKLAEKLGIKICCFVSDEDVAQCAKKQNMTRSMAAVNKAAQLPGKKIFVVGNAPTALYRMIELQETGGLEVEAIVGVPVGFVGAAESKETLWKTDIPSIMTRGRKGGSTIAVAIINAVMKEAVKQIGS